MYICTYVRIPTAINLIYYEPWNPRKPEPHTAVDCHASMNVNNFNCRLAKFQLQYATAITELRLMAAWYESPGSPSAVLLLSRLLRSPWVSVGAKNIHFMPLDCISNAIEIIQRDYLNKIMNMQIFFIEIWALNLNFWGESGLVW